MPHPFSTDDLMVADTVEFIESERPLGIMQSVEPVLEARAGTLMVDVFNEPFTDEDDWPEDEIHFSDLEIEIFC